MTTDNKHHKHTNAQVPAVTAARLREGAFEEVGNRPSKPQGGDRPQSWEANAQRNAWRLFRRMGVGWKIPTSDFDFDTGEGEVLTIPYIKPKSYLEYLLCNATDVVVGGVTSIEQIPVHLRSFWKTYEQQHKTHCVFTSAGEDRDLSYTVPIVLHGDEGRGKRRTGTLVISMESPLGIPSLHNRKRKNMECDCNPPAHQTAKYNNCTMHKLEDNVCSISRAMVTNNRGHSFLQKWPIIVIPGVVYVAYPSIVHKFNELLARELRSIFYEGFVAQNRIFTAACLGLKADLKYHTKVGRLTRSYEHKGRVRDLPACHLCLGGTPGIPWENVEEAPCWEPTICAERPWNIAGPQPPLVPIPFSNDAPETFFRTDPFHTGKVGALRDVVGSTLFWLLECGYYGERGDLGGKLQAAHGAFKLYCLSTKQVAALRSFTKHLFQYKSRKSFPWSNTKGSDTTLLCRFLVVQLGSFMVAPLDPQHVATLDLMKRTISSGLSYYSRLESHGLFLERRCALAVYLDGSRYIAGYCLLAQQFLGTSNLFAVKPKLHMWRHTLVEIRQLLENGAMLIQSPMTWNCESNEDAIGRLSKLSRRLDSRGMSGRILSCFLIKAHLLHTRHLKPSKKAAGSRTLGARSARKWKNDL